MSSYDFTYTFPSNFNNTVVRLIKNHYSLPEVSRALESCKINHQDVGNAYRAGIKGDNWNMNALDFTIEGTDHDISTLEQRKPILKQAFDQAIRSRETGFQVREIFLLPNDDAEVLPSSDSARLDSSISDANEVLDRILLWGRKTCSNKTFASNLDENGFNDSLRDSLSLSEKWEVMDQTRHGLSPDGKDAGSVDLLVSKSNKEAALIEGLKLSSVNKGYIDSHIKKAVGPYNPLGTPVFLLCYVSVKDFGSFWSKCMEYLDSYDFPLEVKSNLIERPRINASTRIASMMLSRDGYDFPLYFIAFKLLK